MIAFTCTQHISTFFPCLNTTFLKNRKSDFTRILWCQYWNIYVDRIFAPLYNFWPEIGKIWCPMMFYFSFLLWHQAIDHLYASCLLIGSTKKEAFYKNSQFLLWPEKRFSHSCTDPCRYNSGGKNIIFSCQIKFWQL